MNSSQSLWSIFLTVFCSLSIAQSQPESASTPIPTQLYRTEQVRVILSTPIQQTTTASALP